MDSNAGSQHFKLGANHHNLNN